MFVSLFTRHISKLQSSGRAILQIALSLVLIQQTAIGLCL